MFYYRKLILKEGFKIGNKICTCFGHREVSKNIAGVLSEVVEDLVLSCGVTEFWTGGMGKTDEIFAAVVRNLKNKYPNIKLVLIKPYITSELRNNPNYYKNTFDSVVIPNVVVEVNYKCAIPKRNEWMVYNSDFVITYVCKNTGGAYNAKNYARKMGKIIFEVNDMLTD